MKKNRVRNILIVLSLAGVVCFMTVALLVMDESPLKDDDLQPAPRAEIPDEENAIFYFIRAAEKLYNPYERWDEMAGGPWEDMMCGDIPWDAELAREILEKNTETFELMEKGLACTSALAPEFTAETLESVFGQYRSPWRRIMRLYQLRGRHLARNGRHKEALGEALKAVKFGSFLKNCRGGWLCFLTGAAIQGVGLADIRDLLSDTELEPDALRACIPVLDTYRIDDEAFADNIRIGYRLFIEHIEMIRTGKDQALDQLGFPPPMRAYSFKPNKTKRMMAEACRTTLANLNRKVCDLAPLGMSSELAPRMFFGPERSTLQKVRLCLTENAAGKMIFTGAAYSLSELSGLKCQQNDKVSATQIAIALKCHKLKTGKLAESLDELAPEYFEAVPTSEYDGKPMRYSNEEKTIYIKHKSSEVNMFGVGGNMKDIEIKIEF
ncbi:MAG: hypothetical protein HQ592_15610 [Planctomycetes bacterium]|nr:hypothetical protein [Planctomycetota bacterium]